MKRAIAFNILLVLVLSAFNMSHAATFNVVHTYDNLDRLTKIDYGRGVYIEYIYDDAGNITTVVSTGKAMLPGDIDGSGSVDLTDAMIGLHVITGLASPHTVHADADVNGDGRIGAADVVYILQHVAKIK